MTANSSPPSPECLAEDDLRKRGQKSFFEGRHADAFGEFHASLLNRALRWFREEGVTFQRPPGKVTPTELLVGLHLAAEAEIRSRGDAVSDKLSVAGWLFEAVANLRLRLDRHMPDNDARAGAEAVAELIAMGIMLGQIDLTMTTIEAGWWDAVEAHHAERERRRAGARETNAKRATAKELALGEAIRIAGKNPTLSNEELALKIRQALGASTTVKTLTGWVREWRRQSFIQAATPT